MRFMKGNSISAWIPFHLQLFTKKSVHLLMKEAGFADIKIYGYNPTSWLPASIMQWKYRKQATAKYDHSIWLTWACYPIGWLAAKFGMGEELVATGRLSYRERVGL